MMSGRFPGEGDSDAHRPPVAMEGGTTDGGLAGYEVVEQVAAPSGVTHVRIAKSGS